MTYISIPPPPPSNTNLCVKNNKFRIILWLEKYMYYLCERQRLEQNVSDIYGKGINKVL